MANQNPSQEVIDAVQRMQHYIEENLKNLITQRQLAKAAGYSHFYSAKIFKELIGISPFEYIRRYRLTQAALELRENHVKVIDVALDYVFDSHEGFTRAFSKEFGVNPKKYSKNPIPIQYFLPNNIEGYYHLKSSRNEANTMSNEQSTIFVQIIERPKRKVLLKRGTKATHYFEYCEEVGCEIWELLSSIKEALYEPIGMWMPASLQMGGTSEYVQGVEVPFDYDGAIPDDLEMIVLPACSMLIFQGQPYDDENFQEAIGQLWEQTKNFDPTIYGYKFDDEIAPRFQLAPMGYRGYIEGRPVRKISNKQV